jgi:hypothetical protein
MKDTSSLPQVMIAGLTTHMLDWQTVLNIVFSKVDIPTSVLQDPDPITGSLIQVTQPKDEKTIWQRILLFFKNL